MSPVLFLMIEIFFISLIIVIIRQAERTRNLQGSLELNYVLLGISVLKLILIAVIAYLGMSMCDFAKSMYC